MDIQPSDIKKEIGKRPPAQKAVAAIGYIGIKPSKPWELEFFNISDVYNDTNKWDITGCPKGELYPDVMFQVFKNEYPEFNNLHSKTLFWVSGQISEVSDSGLHIVLSDIVVYFSKPENQAVLTSIHNTFIDSSIHYGKGDIIDKSKAKVNVSTTTQNNFPWWLTQIVLPLFVAIIAGYIIYSFGWNH